MANRTVLHVSGFPHDFRARDLAWEFERYGRLIRCDIPALRPGQSSPFAFVEFRYPEDAEDAYYDMHGRFIEGRRVSVQWAKRPPAAGWRNDRREPPPRRRSPTPPPRRRSPTPPPRRRSPSPRRDDDPRDDRRRSLSPQRDDRDARPSKRSPSPVREPETNGTGDHDAEDDRERRDD